MDQLGRIEAYYDAVPRALVSAQEAGPFTVFHRSQGWPYYARPTLGGGGPFTARDVERVRALQRRLVLPEAFEWVDELAPGLAAAVRATGLEVHGHQLMVLTDPQPAPVPDGYTVRLLEPGDPALAAARAAIKLGFGHGGTQRAAVGALQRDIEVASGDQAADFISSIMRRGLNAMAVAEDATGPVAGGSFSPRGEVAEITGVATLPAARRRGLALAVTSALIAEARNRGVELCFLSAENDDVARIYARLGFTRVATAMIAER